MTKESFLNLMMEIKGRNYSNNEIRDKELEAIKSLNIGTKFAVDLYSDSTRYTIFTKISENKWKIEEYWNRDVRDSYEKDDEETISNIRNLMSCIESKFDDYVPNYGFIRDEKLTESIKNSNKLEENNMKEDEVFNKILNESTSELSETERGIVEDIAKADFECGMPQNDYTAILECMEEDDDIEHVNAAAEYYQELIEMGPAGFYEEFPEMDWSDDYIAEYGNRKAFDESTIFSKIVGNKLKEAIREEFFDCVNSPMSINSVADFIENCEHNGHAAILTVNTSDGRAYHTQFNSKSWKEFKDAINGVDDFSRNSNLKGAAITKVWAKECDPKNTLGESTIFENILKGENQ